MIDVREVELVGGPLDGDLAHVRRDSHEFVISRTVPGSLFPFGILDAPVLTETGRYIGDGETMTWNGWQSDP